MVDKNVIETTMRIEADAAAAKRTEARVNKVISGLEKLQKKQKDPAAKEAIQDQIDLYKKEGFEIVRNTELLEQQTKENEKQAKLASQIAKATGQAPSRGRGGDGAGGVTRADLGEIGDVETSVRALGGAVGALGGEAGRAVEGVVAIGAEIPAAIEAAGQLPIALKGLPASGQAAVAAMTGVTVGMGTLAVAAVAVTAAIAIVAKSLDGLKKAGEEQAEVFERARTAEDARIDAIGMNREEIEAEIAANEELIRQSEEKADFRRRQLEDLDEPSNILFQIGDGLGIVGQAGDQTSESLEQLEKQTEEARAANEGLTEALNQTTEAAADTTDALLEEVDKVGELTDFRQKALQANGEALEQLNGQLDQERQRIEKQIAVIEQSGDVSDKAQERLAQLNDELELSQEKSAILAEEEIKKNAAYLDSLESTKDLAKEEENLAKEREAAAKKTQDALQKENQAINDFILSAVAGDPIKEALVEEQEKRLEFIEKSGEEELKAREDFDKKKRDLTRDQSFLELIDLQDDFSDKSKERAKERRADLAKLNQELAEERAIKVADAQAEQLEKMQQLQANQQAVADARAEEERLVRTSQETQIQLQQSRFNRETQLYQQMGQQFEQYAGQIQQTMSQLFANIPSAGGMGGGDLAGFGSDAFTRQLQEVFG